MAIYPLYLTYLKRRYDGHEEGQIERLYQRGFVVRHADNKPKVTASGRAALVIWKIIKG